MDFKNFIIEGFNTPENKHCLTTEFDRVTKSIELAKDIRVSGNELYIECKHNAVMHERIWDSYLCSIALSPNGSEALATSYGNMSALMFHLSKYQECIKNIEYALKITESTPLKVKLLCRKAKCLSALGISEKDNVFKEAKFWLDKIDNNDKSKQDLIQLVDKAKIVLDKNKVKIKRIASIPVNEDTLNQNKIKRKKKGKKGKIENSEFEHLQILAQKEKENIFTSVAVRYSDEYSSHLVAMRDIQAGEIIFVVKPYIIVPHFTKSQNFCNNCLNVVWCGIPCQNCACCMYCSEECQNEAMQKYHTIECPILQFLVSGDTVLDYYVQASLRTIIMAVKEFGSIENLKYEINKIDTCTDNDGQFNNFRHDSFISLFGFKNTYVRTEILNNLIQACCRAVICLTKYTSFFEDNYKFDTIEDFQQNEDTVFIGVLLLRVAVIAFNNCIKVSEYGLFCQNYVDSTTCISEEPCCEKGYSLNTLSQFIPHSCNPNVKSMKTIGCKEIYYALQPIYEGEPLLECYKFTFFELDSNYRCKMIAQILNRDCYCVACQEDWPSLLIENDNMISIENVAKIVMESREHNNQKERFFNLVNKHGLAHQDIVDELSRIMEANYNYFGQPSVEVCATMRLLSYVFNKLYGEKLNMPNTCKTGLL